MRIFKQAVSLLLVLVVLCTCTTLPSLAVSTVSGLTLEASDSYKTVSLSTALPSTYEATVYFPAATNANDRGGVIVGNYKEAKVDCISFEIHKNGNPRLYIIDPNDVTYDVIFTNVNVITGAPAHVAVTMDAATDTYSCYLNGELKQTITADVPAAFPLNAPLGLGGDLRSGNGQYFKGTLQGVRLYADVRSAQEIAADMTTMDTTDLVGNYDLLGTTSAQNIVECTEKIGPTFEKPVTMFDNLNPVTDFAYSFAVLGDIQTMTAHHPDGLVKMYDWLLENKESRKIEAVLGLGDMVDSYTVDAEYELVKAQMKRLDGIIPHTFVRGNHDQSDYFNKHFTYKEYKHIVSGARDGWDMKNTYTKLEIGGHKYLILCLDLSASSTTLTWANDVVSSHPDYNVIVTSHIFMDPGQNYTDATKYGGSKTCQQIFDEFVSQHENIVMFLSGHHPTDNIVRKEVTGVKGNKIQQILIDPQTTDKGYDEGTGLIAMFNFSEDGSFVQVEYYSVIQQQFFLRGNQFTFQLNVVQPDGTLYVPEPVESAILPIHTHMYTAACDTACDFCNRGRTAVVGHTFTNGCDTACNVCGTTRAIEHVYDNACDDECNECQNKRTVPHAYDNACDADCNECGAQRRVPDHIYKNDCDTDCNECGAVRVTEHRYDDYHVCTECGAIRADGAGAMTLKPSLELVVGATQTLTVTGASDITWLSNNESVAVVADGTITAQAVGTAVITATSAEYGTVYSVVTVVPANVLTNGDFEQGATAEWSSNAALVMEGIGKDGSWGLQSVRTDASKPGKANYYKAKLLGYLKPNTTYELSFDYKNTGTGCGQVYFIQSFGNIVKSTGVNQFSDANELINGAWLTKGDVDWSRVSIVFRTGETIAANKGWELNMRSVEGVGTTYYDNISVKPVVEINDIQLDAETVELQYKEQAAVNATLRYTSAVAPTITWTSADETVATVKDGVITAVGKGSTVITASAEGMYPVLCYVTVPDPCKTGHSYDNDCDTTCNVCDDERTVAGHKYDNACDKDCNSCGATRATSHKYDSGKVTKAATCKATGVKTYTCTVCKVTKTETIAKKTTHTYTNACDKTCNVCGATRTTSHSYTKKVTKATLTANGKIQNVCKVCGYTASTSTTIYRPTSFKLSATSYTYNGAVKTPTVTVKDAAGKTISSSNYTVTYATGRKNAGTYSVKITMKGNYTGTKTLTFKINPISISKCKLSLSATTYTYDGKVKTPSVVVKNAGGTTLTKNTHYTVTYASGRKNAGTYKVTVKMKGNYGGSKTLSFKINPISISKCKLSLSATSYTYDGKTKTPSVVVKNASGTKLTKNTHYTVTYASGRKNVGTYKVTIKMKGNYSGTKTLTFKVNPAKTTVSKLTPATKSLKVSITKKSTQVTGYQIQYSTSKTFKSVKTVTISSYKTTSTTIKSLKAKTTYYVRVRTYKTVGGVKYYSGWSTVKYAKTK